MPTFRLSFLAVVAVVLTTAVVSCKDDVKPSANVLAKLAGWWPEAPQPQATGGRRAFAYRPENVKAYGITVALASTPGSMISVAANMNLRLAFQDGATARSRDALIGYIDFDLDAAGKRTAMRLEDEQLTVLEGLGPPIRRRRGQSGLLDAILDKPFSTLTFTEENQVEVTTSKDHPFVTSGGDLLDTALIVFPDLPSEPVARGHRWTTRRNVHIGRGSTRFDVTYTLEYLGDSPCPRGGGNCAQIGLVASSGEIDTVENSIKLKVSYDFVGKVFFDLDRGSIDESRIRMDMTTRAGTQHFALTGTFTVKPT